MSQIFVGLVHYPVYNKHFEVVNTAITNLDLHDIARTVVTYDCQGYYVIQPDPEQCEIAQDILDYWQQGYGSTHHTDRARAFATVRLVPSIGAAIEAISAQTGVVPQVVITDAKAHAQMVDYGTMAAKMAQGGSYLVLFGTGWGLTEEIVTAPEHLVLAPIAGRGDYNHLSVRSAVAIILDRLLSR